MLAILLAGGKASRLRSVVNDRPKPMAQIGRYPFLKYQIAWLARWGVNEITISAGYMAEYFRSTLDSLATPGVSLKVLVEHTPLGTAGAIKFAESIAQQTMLVLNGDTFCDIDISKLVEYHNSNCGLATLALLRVDNVSGRGVVEFEGATGKLTGFVEKQNDCAPGLINAGVYVIERQLLEQIPANYPASLETDILPAQVRAGSVFGMLFSSELIDIGTPAGLAEANRCLPRLFADRGWI